MRHFLRAAALALACGAMTITNAQQQSVQDQGFALYEQGKYTEVIRFLNSAVKAKENKNNAEIWNTLGLAYFATGDAKKASKAMTRAVSAAPTIAVYRANLAHIQLMQRNYKTAESEASKAIELDPRQAHSYYVRGTVFLSRFDLGKAQSDADRAIGLDPAYALGYLLASEINIAALTQKLAKSEDGAAGTSTMRENVGILKRSAEILNSGLANAKRDADKDRIQKELSGINAFVEHFSREPRTPGQVTVPDPRVTPLKILTKPKANYTDAARNNNVQGSIRLAILLGASGKVEGIILLSRLGYGLDQNAIAAARQVKFEPKMIDGKPVSTVVTFDYGFNIY